MAARRLCRNCICRNVIAFFIRLERRIRLDGTVFGRERIDVGAYEAALLAHASLCRRAKLFL